MISRFNTGSGNMRETIPEWFSSRAASKLFFCRRPGMKYTEYEMKMRKEYLKVALICLFVQRYFTCRTFKESLDYNEECFPSSFWGCVGAGNSTRAFIQMLTKQNAPSSPIAHSILLPALLRRRPSQNQAIRAPNSATVLWSSI